MQGKFENLSGQKFGKWNVLDEHKSDGRTTFWLCECECGTQRFVRSHTLKNGTSKSCGCIQATHRDSRSRLYGVWSAMKRRCYNANDAEYHRYGGRGITVCEEWRKSYESFKEWAISNGYDDNAPYGEYTIDRIDFAGNYWPENCRFANMKEQSRNRSSNHHVVYQGKDYLLSDLAELLGIKQTTLAERLKAGWSDEELSLLPTT